MCVCLWYMYMSIYYVYVCVCTRACARICVVHMYECVCVCVCLCGTQVWRPEDNLTVIPQVLSTLWVCLVFLFVCFLSFLVLFFWFLFVVWDRVSLCRPCWPETGYVDQAGLKLPEVCLLLPHSCLMCFPLWVDEAGWPVSLRAPPVQCIPDSGIISTPHKAWLLKVGSGDQTLVLTMLSP